MADWLYHLPVVWMAVVVFAVTLLISGAIYVAVLALATGERGRAFKAMSPVMLTPLAVVFGLIVAFLASGVWTDGERANTAVIREANALRSVVVLAAYYPQEQETRIRAFVRRHIQNAVNEEWPAMAKRRANLPLISARYTEGLQLALSIVPQNEAQMIAQREMVSSLQSAFDARRQRIIISESTINWVKWSVVGLLAVLLLVTIAIIHSDNRATAAISMAIFSVAVAASIVLIASHNRPFTGEISVGPALLKQVLPEEKP
jgi:hypothetical protein